MKDLSSFYILKAYLLDLKSIRYLFTQKIKKGRGQMSKAEGEAYKNW